MSTVLGTIEAILGMDTRQFVAGAERAKRSMSDLDRGGQDLTLRIQNLGLAALRGGQILAAAWITKEVVRNTIEAQRATAQLEAAVKSTGGTVGYTARQLEQQAAALQHVTSFDDEAIKSAQAILLMATSLRGVEFEKATRLSADLATRMGTDVTSAARQLGMSLEDPAMGLMKLSRAGIMFTADETMMVKKMAEAGDVAGAQAMILDLLDKKVGGSAKAVRDTLGGALDYLKNQFRDTLEISQDSSKGVIGAINAMGDAMPWLRKQIDHAIEGYQLLFEAARNAKDPRYHGPLVGGDSPKARQEFREADDFYVQQQKMAADAATEANRLAKVREADEKAAEKAAKAAAKAEKEYRDAIKERVAALKQGADLGTLNKADLAAAAKLEAELLARSQDATLSLTERNVATQQLIDVATALHAKENQQAQDARETAAAWSAVTTETDKALKSLQDYINAGQGKTVKAPGSPTLDQLGFGVKKPVDWEMMGKSFLLPIAQQVLQQGGGWAGGMASGALSGAMMGGLPGAAVGALGGLMSSIVGLGDAAQQAQRQLAAAQAAWKATVDDMAYRSKQLRGETSALEDEMHAINQRINQQLTEAIKAHGLTSTKSLITSWDELETAIKRIQDLLAGGGYTDKQKEYYRKVLEAYKEVEAANQEYIDAWKADQEKKRQEQQKSLDEDIAIRELETQGRAADAEMARLLAQQEKELAEARAANLDTTKLEAQQERERASLAARQAEDARRTARGFGANVGEREALLAGNNPLAIQIRMQEAAAKELEDAKKLLEAGTITQELFDRLAAVLGGELNKALEDAANAARDAAAAFEGDLRVRELSVEGKTSEAELLRLQLQQADEMKRAMDAGMSQDLIDRLKAVQDAERKAREAELTASAAGNFTPTIENAAVAGEVVRNVMGITSDQAVRMTDQLSTVNAWLGEIAFNTRVLRGDGPSIFPLGGVGVGARNIDEDLGRVASTRARLQGIQNRA